jgi:hypothetical protein
MRVMATVATVLAVLALAGALASWIAGAVFYAHALTDADRDHRRLRWLVIVAWPCAIGRIEGAAAAKVNKAVVAFMTCTLVAAAAVAASTNLHRIAR